MSTLIIGGAGYIGTHLCSYLLKKNENVISFDNYSTGNKRLLPIGAIPYKGDMDNVILLKEVIENNPIDKVVLLAAFTSVQEGQLSPEKYYQNNIVKTMKALEVIFSYNKVKSIVFSSSALSAEKNLSCYGFTKKYIESELREKAKGSKKTVVSLRLFNVIGALPEKGIGESHKPETHLIPNVCKSVLKEKTFNLFGDCERDYVDVMDVCSAFERVLNLSFGSYVFEVGSGKTRKTTEVINIFEKVVGEKVKVNSTAVRQGDIDSISSKNLDKTINLGWMPKVSIEESIGNAWRWHGSRI